MGAGRSGCKRGRTSQAKRRSRQLSKCSEASRPHVVDGDESAEAEEIDRLLLSSLRLWEVERDLIEERMAARKSVKTRALHRTDIAA